MLIDGKDLLAVADAHNFAVPAFNVSDYAMRNGLFEVCERKGAPWILAIHPDEVAHIGQDVIVALRERAHRSSVPVAIHWDHGGAYDEILTAIRIGFTSVMIDGSMLPFEENVALTRRVVEAAHAVGLSVEGELGTIGKTDDQAEAGTDDIIYTEPAQAAEFVERTGVDSLAVAIGTRHGIYPATLKPELRLDLLTEIKRVVGIPLVLHGGSNNPDSEIAQAVTLGINKINISSDIKVAYFDEMRAVLADRDLREPNLIEPPAVLAMQKVAAEKIDLFGAAGKAHLYADGLADATLAEREQGVLVG
ncbi:MAG: ketose-bisphosphate aldolase [Leifsonia sp.]